MSNLRLTLAVIAVAAPGALIAIDRPPGRPAARTDAAMATVKRGVEKWQSGEYPAAVAAWRPAAEAGDADAQFDMAQAYKLGRGVPADMRQAEGWYKKAAVQGHEPAQATLGLIMFQNGDRAGAMPWLQQAAERGEPRAEYVYGTALFNGDVATKDWPRAYAMMTRAAAAGLPQAKSSLAQMDQFVPMAQRQQGTAMAAAPTAPRAPSASPRSALVLASNAPQSVRNAPLPPSSAPANTYATQPMPAATPADAADPGSRASAAPPAAAVAHRSPPETTRAAPRVAPIAAKAPAPARGPAAPPRPPVAPPRPAAGAPRPAPIAASHVTPRVAAPPAKAPSSARAPAIASSASPAGSGWRIQLGAFGTPAAAQALWTSVSAHAPALRALPPFYVKAGAITRLQAGRFATRAAASAACRAASAASATCFPVNP